MGTKINWCSETINPIVGCSKISAGCQHCYAENMARRLAAMGLEQYQSVVDIRHCLSTGSQRGVWNGHTAFVPSELDKPYKWKKPRTIFVSSMGDLFHDSVPFEWVDQVLHTAKYNPAHTFIFLTKRPNRMLEYFTGMSQPGAGTPTARRLLSHPNYSSTWHGLHMIYLKGGALPNLILGVSAEDQETTDERVRVLLQIPATKRFISLEPMIGLVDLYRGGWSFLSALHPPPGNKTGWKRGLDGVILGGESGPKARPLDPAWVRLVRDQCADACVPFMFKQFSSCKDMVLGKWYGKDGFPELDGRTHTELAWEVRK